jgi:hypothetical protein
MEPNGPIIVEIIRAITTLMLFVLKWMHDRVPKMEPQKYCKKKKRIKVSKGSGDVHD